MSIGWIIIGLAAAGYMFRRQLFPVDAQAGEFEVEGRRFGERLNWTPETAVLRDWRPARFRGPLPKDRAELAPALAARALALAAEVSEGPVGEFVITQRVDRRLFYWHLVTSFVALLAAACCMTADEQREQDALLEAVVREIRQRSLREGEGLAVMATVMEEWGDRYIEHVRKTSVSFALMCVVDGLGLTDHLARSAVAIPVAEAGRWFFSDSWEMREAARRP